MRVQHVLMISAFTLIAAAPAAAQNETTPVSNQASSATADKAEPAKPKVTPASDKICKRMTNGKVCKTAEEWRKYEQMY